VADTTLVSNMQGTKVLNLPLHHFEQSLVRQEQNEEYQIS